MKRELFLLAACFTLTSCNGPQKSLEEKFTVAYYYNINKQQVVLPSGLSGEGNSVCYHIEYINKGGKATPPEVDPVRENYDFKGWHIDPEEDSPFNFENEINANTMIFAHWKVSEEGGEEIVEPKYEIPTRIDDSINDLIDVKGILNMFIESGSCKVSKAALERIISNKNDLSDLLNYKIKTGVTLEATYDEGTKKVSYKASKGVEEKSGEFTIVDNSLNWVDSDSNYENKAKNYEQNSSSIEPHHICLAGSSSMENWTTSKEDLQPLVTFNHGIGGTGVEDWLNHFNQRLVYPFTPKMVVYYLGVNNIINREKNPAKTIADLKAMFDDVHNHLPNAKVFYVLINALPGYMDYLASINLVNDAIIEYSSSHPFLKTLNPGKLLLKDDGVTPNSAFFVSDGLHMSKAGYVLWGGFIKDEIVKGLKEW